MATPFGRMKAAWDSSDRNRELNRVVEVMAAEGVARDELESALVALLTEVRAAGTDDETEEIINCVGDRLHGWGNPKYHIHARDPVVAPTSANRHNDPSSKSAAPTDAR